MSVELEVALISAVSALLGTALGLFGSEIRENRKRQVAEEGARTLCDVRLVEVVQLLLPSWQSGLLSAANIAVLSERIERLDEADIATTFRADFRKVVALGQVSICSCRLERLLSAQQKDPESVKQNSHAGIANAVLAITNPDLQTYAQKLAKSAGFEMPTTTYVMAQARHKDTGERKTVKFDAGDDTFEVTDP